jgi:Fe-Mn family superoxide dismutase
MQSEYGVGMHTRLLEEIMYWKMQEQEHTVVIRSLVPELEPAYVQWLQQWEEVFSKTKDFAQHTKAVLESSPNRSLPADWEDFLPKLVEDSTNQSREFSRQLQLLPEYSAAVGLTRDASVALDYIRRQPEYFQSVFEQLDRSGVFNQVRSPDGEEDSPEGFGGPEPADGDMRPVLVKTPEDESERPEGTWSNPSPMGDIGQSNPVVFNPVPIGGHQLPPLPYSYRALEPYIDEKTMRIHHDKHHQSYVEGLNKAEKKLEEARRTGDFDLVKNWERELAFNGAGHYLHTLFWDTMSPKGGGKPNGALLEEINRSFGSYDAFKKQFTEAANKVEGGGWAILVWSPRSHRLEILTAEKHQNLSQWDVVPLLPLDVWEHAYYLKHQNDRPAYTSDWWNVVNWPYVADRFAKARTLEWIPY